MIEKKCATVGVISNSQFFRKGVNALLIGRGYSVAVSVRDHRELEAIPTPIKPPTLVLVHLVRDIETAANQLHSISNILPSAGIVAFSNEVGSDWLDICEKYSVSALLSEQVSFRTLLRSLERVINGERVLPTNIEVPSGNTSEAPSNPGFQDRNRVGIGQQGDVIPCMTCSVLFETRDRRANRICSSCKSRISRVSSAMEHTLHY